MFDQKHHWNEIHKKGKLEQYGAEPTEFAGKVLPFINPASKILELGCGVGNDSVSFANAGHLIIATDFSEVVIEKNTEKFKDIPNLSFQVMDMTQPMRFNNSEFDLVYARLSLHYFKDTITRSIFSEIHRILKPNGLLCFICKSTSDSLYGKGIEIEKDMYQDNQHIRHFFSEEYTKSLLNTNFMVEKIESDSGKIYSRESSFIKVIAKAVKL